MAYGENLSTMSEEIELLVWDDFNDIWLLWDEMKYQGHTAGPVQKQLTEAKIFSKLTQLKQQVYTQRGLFLCGFRIVREILKKSIITALRYKQKISNQKTDHF